MSKLTLIWRDKFKPASHRKISLCLYHFLVPFTDQIYRVLTGLKQRLFDKNEDKTLSNCRKSRHFVYFHFTIYIISVCDQYFKLDTILKNEKCKYMYHSTTTTKNWAISSIINWTWFLMILFFFSFASALKFIRYIYGWNLQFLNNVNYNNKKKLISICLRNRWLLLILTILFRP